MALNFPASPTTGQVFESNGYLWQWDGASWSSNNGYLSVNREEFIATEGQQEFTLTVNTYSPNTNTLSLYVDGVRQFNNYVETSSMIFTFNSPLTAGQRVLAEWFIPTFAGRFVTGHSDTHQLGGADPLTPSMIGAPTLDQDGLIQHSQLPPIQGMVMHDDDWHNINYWHAGNDGPGSGLDADTLDGHDSSYFATSGHAHTTYDRASSVLSGANVFSNIVVTDGIVTSIATRAMTAANVGAIATTGGTATGSLSGTTLGVTNTSATTGNGISLYGSYSSGQPTYGLMFAGTPTFGTHGAVTGDWATYFTMNATANRGWVFRAGTSNVASVAANGYVYGARVYGAVFNDYAEYRQSKNEINPGTVVVDVNGGYVEPCKKRLSPGGMVISDTYGFAIGEQDIEGEVSLPIAVAGRALVYTDKDKESFKIGDAVCTGEAGTVSKMRWWEKIIFPDRILGTVSEIPDYRRWGSDNTKVDGRIWIKVR